MVVSIEVPRLGLHMQRVKLSEWYLPDGAAVEAGEAVCRLETDNVAVEIEAEGSGVLRHRRGTGVNRPAEDVLGVVLAPGERMPDFPADDCFESQPHRLAGAAGEPSKREWEMAVQLLHYWPDEEEQALLLVEPKPEPAAAPAASSPEPAVTHGEAARRGFELLPFPSREPDAEEAPSSWGPVPGDSVTFDTELFEAADVAGPPAPAEEAEPEELSFAEALAAFTANDEPEARVPANVIDEPPAKPVSWQAWAKRQTLNECPEANLEPAEGRPVPSDPVPAREVLTMRVTVDLTEVAKLREQLSHEWQREGLSPSTGDVALRAIARALEEAALDERRAIALRTVFEGGETMRTLPRASRGVFREAVAAMAEGGAAFEDVACIVTAFAEVDDASPRLRGGDSVAFALGAEREGLRWDADRPVAAVVSTLALAYDRARVDDATGARLLSRARELLEAPYALLAA